MQQRPLSVDHCPRTLIIGMEHCPLFDVPWACYRDIKKGPIGPFQCASALDEVRCGLCNLVQLHHDFVLRAVLVELCFSAHQIL